MCTLASACSNLPIAGLGSLEPHRPMLEAFPRYQVPLESTRQCANVDSFAQREHGRRITLLGRQPRQPTLFAVVSALSTNS
eukprot:2901246-Alexandrium_andersonii.AAC.1